MAVLPERFNARQKDPRIGANPAQRVLGYAAGQLGFAENKSVLDQVITAGALLSGLSVTVVIGANRRIEATCKTNLFSSVIEDSAYFEIRLDGVAMDRAYVNRLSGASEQTIQWSSISTPSVGSHTYTVFGIRNGGTGVITNRSRANLSTFLLVEDIGVA